MGENGIKIILRKDSFRLILLFVGGMIQHLGFALKVREMDRNVQEARSGLSR